MPFLGTYSLLWYCDANAENSSIPMESKLSIQYTFANVIRILIAVKSLLILLFPTNRKHSNAISYMSEHHISHSATVAGRLKRSDIRHLENDIIEK